jgi:hypothetical protein
MYVALTLPNTVSNQETSRWGVVQSFDALSPEGLNTSFFLPAVQESPMLTTSFGDVNALQVGTESKQIAATERMIIQLNEEFAQLAFSVRDFNRVSSASEPVTGVVTPPRRLQEDKEEMEKLLALHDFQVAA